MELSQEDIQSSVKDFEDLTEEFKTFSVYSHILKSFLKCEA